MNKISIALKKLSGLVLTNSGDEQGSSDTIALTLNAELMRLGFTMSRELLKAMSRMMEAPAQKLAVDLLAEVKSLRGDHVAHKPMYPNFPQQVIEASNVEIYSNALSHYWSFGEWLQEYKILPRKFAFEFTKFREIALIPESVFKEILPQLLGSSDSLSQEDKNIISWFLSEYSLRDLGLPSEIPFAENRCVLAGELLSHGLPFAHLIATTTDVLRLATYFSGGDVSLAENTKFKSFPRKVRKQLVSVLESVIDAEDIARHQKKWVRLFHSLHVGELSIKVNKIAFKARNNLKVKTFYGELESLIEVGDLQSTVNLLSTRPSEFGRRLDQVIRMTSDEYEQLLVVEKFLSVADEIPSRNLLQLLGHINRRNNNIERRVIFPKGNVQKAVIVKSYLAPLYSGVISDIQNGINGVLIKRFSAQKSLGKVWIDPSLVGCPLPTQQRSSSEGLFSVARGTRLPLRAADEVQSLQQTLRFFVYWVGQDVDLSATFHDENFNMVEQISYTNIRSNNYKAYHSGDITSAPNGASEFIDIDISSAKKHGARYVVMNVMVYSGPTFEDHEECFAGWMLRSSANSNEIYEPKTVKQKIDIRTGSKNVMPVAFDLYAGKSIWVDISVKGSFWAGGNNVHSNMATIQEKLDAIVSADHKLSLYDLFSLHAMSRGSVVSTQEEADVVFSINKGVTPYDINTINAEYIN